MGQGGRDLTLAFAADVDFGDAQFVGVRVLTALHHFPDYDAVEAAGDRLNAIYFEARHGDLIGKRFAVDRRVNPFA